MLPNCTFIPRECCSSHGNLQKRNAQVVTKQLKLLSVSFCLQRDFCPSIGVNHSSLLNLQRAALLSKGEVFLNLLPRSSVWIFSRSLNGDSPAASMKLLLRFCLRKSLRNAALDVSREGKELLLSPVCFPDQLILIRCTNQRDAAVFHRPNREFPS